MTSSATKQSSFGASGPGLLRFAAMTVSYSHLVR
jgi:hypothetical protein